MTAKHGFKQLVDDLWAGDNFTTADAVAKHLELDDTQREYLISLIVNGVRMVRREQVSRHEDYISPTPPTVKMVKTQVAPPVAGDPELMYLDDWFALGDGRHMTWRTATVKDHEQRIALYEMQRGAALKKIDKHLAVIARIKINKVTCLGDLYPRPEEAA